jgi:hypothetical protein
LKAEARKVLVGGIGVGGSAGVGEGRIRMMVAVGGMEGVEEAGGSFGVEDADTVSVSVGLGVGGNVAVSRL